MKCSLYLVLITDSQSLTKVHTCQKLQWHVMSNQEFSGLLNLVLVRFWLFKDSSLSISLSISIYIYICVYIYVYIFFPRTRSLKLVHWKYFTWQVC